MSATVRARRTFRENVARRIPGVTALSQVFARLARARVGRIPVGLAALLPVALFIDLFDIADELALGPVGMFVSFLLETAFVLGVTGRATYALGFAGIDLIPGLDIIPFATLTVLKAIGDAWREGAPDAASAPGNGVVIDV